ncbi:hypothetical protein APHAL10511_000032 [Amanita phalloides]|nr:hypothetical protein APHAL10511_000032 [Amanita phalloides]
MVASTSTLDEPPSPASTLGPATPTAHHPVAKTTSKLELLNEHHHHGEIDIEAEIRLYETLVSDSYRDDRSHVPGHVPPPRQPSPFHPPSVYSKDIWLQDNSGASLAFTQDVTIAGWTSVGDHREGAYVVYDCAIRTKEGTTIHKHKRFSAFVELRKALQQSLPSYLMTSIPPLPPKTPFARFRPAFLDRRRRYLHYWLSAVLLHPEIGASTAVKNWVID